MDNKLMFLVLIFFLVLGTFTAFVFNREAVRNIRATNPPPPVQANSFILVSSDGSVCNVNPVVRDADELAVEGAEVCITSTLGTVSPDCALTNSSGISEHAVTSSTPGVGQITAEVTGAFTITTDISCTFN